MSRLLPDHVFIGVFPGYFWLENKQHKIEHQFESNTANEEASLLKEFRLFLLANKDKFPRQSVFHILVSDSLATSVVLPWQDQLLNTEEQLNYARICFDNLGFDIDASWSMQVFFPSFKKNGLAYALPNLWLEELVSIVSESGCRIKRVLPLSAATFACVTDLKSSENRILFLIENSQVTCLILNNGILSGIDIEPVVDEYEIVCERILRRAQVHHSQFKTLIHWSLSPSFFSKDWEFVKTDFPSNQIIEFNRNSWNNAL